MAHQDTQKTILLLSILLKTAIWRTNMAKNEELKDHSLEFEYVDAPRARFTGINYGKRALGLSKNHLRGVL
ncbi:hypothetical protein [Bifidobacterium sp. ESL0745]|uniref:hypothetical protein n=1 Tax=Bifidobacterium sp. ESL0745 TaxID=2983226 RepID=UPI0023F90474|nr:hypothetical protein [Bifidobacterium sp. ESL0745]MDF7666100.1 hypothetical protein [Bifidobacterium sp. ESL0745]